MAGQKNDTSKNLEEKLKAIVLKNKNIPMLEKAPEKSKEKKEEKKPEKESGDEDNFDNGPLAEQANFAPQLFQPKQKTPGLDAPIVANPGGTLEDDLQSVSVQKENVREEKKLYDDGQKKYNSPEDKNMPRMSAATPASVNPFQQVRQAKFTEENMPQQNSNPEEAYKLENIQRAENNSGVMPWESDHNDTSKKYQRHNF